jgi:hypothetical protein
MNAGHVDACPCWDCFDEREEQKEAAQAEGIGE